MNMEFKLIKLTITILLLLACGTTARAQRSAAPRASTPVNDVATLKQKAESGDARAKLALGNKLMENSRPKDALVQFKEIARKGNVEACYLTGEILLYGARGSGEQQVLARPAEGVRWTYRAATNSHALACRNMARALINGLGVKTNLVEGYAWLQLYSERNARRDRKELDALALRVDTGIIQQGQKQAKEFKAKRWPALAVESPVLTQLSLRISGITYGDSGALVVINTRSLAVGESTQFPVGKNSVEVRCIEIGEDFARLEVEGEDEPRLLTFGKI